MSDIQKWGDSQQYHAEPHANYRGEEHGVLPSVSLLWMTPDPLGAVSAMTQMYKGKVVRSLSEVTEEMRRNDFEQIQQTHLTAPLESIKFHFLIEGVDRAFTHQLVRQRTAVYAQESLRFAVPGELREATSLPPSVMGTSGEVEERDRSDEDRWRTVWDTAMDNIDAAYHMLVETGMPAEEARGLLPHATATRVHFVTDMRNLVEHAGNRLCTQAQFHWRMVFNEMIQAIRYYTPDFDWFHEVPDAQDDAARRWAYSNRWQFQELAGSKLWRPACYQQGRCPFKADFDRGCTIRPRVEKFSAHGIPSDKWDVPVEVPVMFHDEGERGEEITLEPIAMTEWLFNPAAARK